MVNDEQLQATLRQARCGDKHAFTRLVRALDGRVRRFIWHLVGHTTAEDDIVQDVFTALHVNLPRMDPPEKLLPFLFRVTRNRCYDLLRKQGRYRVVALGSVPEDALIAERGRYTDDQVHHTLLYLRVKQAMAHLPEPQRQVLILYAEEGFSYEEIAEALAINLGTVKSRLHHARKTLRRLLNYEGENHV